MQNKSDKKIYKVLYLAGLIHIFSEQASSTMEKPTSMFRGDQKGSKTISILKNFPGQNLSHPKQYTEMCQQVGMLVLQLCFYPDCELSPSLSSELQLLSQFPRTICKKNPKML